MVRESLADDTWSEIVWVSSKPYQDLEGSTFYTEEKAYIFFKKIGDVYGREKTVYEIVV